MSRKMTIEARTDRAAIDAALAFRESPASISSRYKVGVMSLWRYRRKMLAEDGEYFKRIAAQLPKREDIRRQRDIIARAMARLEEAKILLDEGLTTK